MDTSFFKSKEFRSLLERYEQMREYGMNSYFSSDDLLELASYYLFKNRAADAENVISYARKLYPGDTQITEAEIRTLLSRGEVQEARRKLNAISVMDTPELQLLKAEVDELRNSCGDAGKLYENLQSLLLRLNGGSANAKRTASA